ncbi:MAG: DUF4834 family protein [Bacteroidaceae bacterium]|nr:DUF4834 family protein [Bacteroidaceae bacterium]
MSAFLTALFTILFIVFIFVLFGLYLMSRLVGGFGNLRAIYRLFSGKGAKNAQDDSAKSSSSGKSSRTYTNKGKTTKNTAQTHGKMFEQNEGTYVEFEEVK